MDFSPVRQYQNAHIIRGLYFDNDESIPESSKFIARLNTERMGFMLEPRIIENLSVLGYRIIGGEHLWIPRVLSSFFWVVGGLFLYLIARMNFSQGVSFFSAVFYLFLPYSILASRAIQPDPLMVMMMLTSIYMIMRYDNNPSKTHLFIAAVISAIAVLIKPYCVFIIFGAFVSIAVLRNGFWRSVFNCNTINFVFIVCSLTLIYYVYGFITDVGFMREHARGSFLPHLLVQPFFWKEWLIMIGKVTGYIALILAIAGIVIMGEGRTRAMFFGLWIGYFIFGISATFQIHTHSYYHMPLIPIVALSLGPIADFVIKRTDKLNLKRWDIMIIIAVILSVISGFLIIKNGQQARNIYSHYKNALKTAATVIGVNPSFSRFLFDDFEEDVRIAREIGEHVKHSANTVILSPHFGRVLAYHGEFSGLPWPTNRSLYGRKLRGTKLPNIKEDFSNHRVSILYQGKIIKYTPDYFIITAFDELMKQKDLKDYLYLHYSVYRKSDDYLIFDLTNVRSRN
jgi:hypothetical protein